jgi:hypothetical protein
MRSKRLLKEIFGVLCFKIGALLLLYFICFSHTKKIISQDIHNHIFVERQPQQERGLN